MTISKSHAKGSSSANTQHVSATQQCRTKGAGGVCVADNSRLRHVDESVEDLLTRIILNEGWDKRSSYGINLNSLRPIQGNAWKADGPRGGADLKYDTITKKLFIEKRSQGSEGETLVFDLRGDDWLELTEIQRGTFGQTTPEGRKSLISGNHTVLRNGKVHYMRLFSGDKAKDCKDTRDFFPSNSCEYPELFMRQIIKEGDLEPKAVERCVDPAQMPGSRCLPTIKSGSNSTSVVMPILQLLMVLGGFQALKFVSNKASDWRKRRGAGAKRVQRIHEEQAREKEYKQKSYPDGNSVNRKRLIKDTAGGQTIRANATPQYVVSQPIQKDAHKGLLTVPSTKNKKKTRGSSPLNPDAQLPATIAPNVSGAEQSKLKFCFDETEKVYCINLTEPVTLTCRNGRELTVKQYVFKEGKLTGDPNFQEKVSQVLAGVDRVRSRHDKGGGGIKFTGSKDSNRAYKLKLTGQYGDFRCLGGYDEPNKRFVFDPPVRHTDVERLMK